MNRSFHFLAAAAALAVGTSLAAQAIPEIAYEANADLLKLPENIHIGEAAGVATNSKGHIFVYTRTGASHATLGTSRTFYKAGSRLLEFDQTGKFVREIGVGVYGFNNAQAVRIDPQDNIWVVDRGSTQVIKFDPDGRILLVMSRKPEAIAVRAGATGGAGRGGAPEGRGGPPAEGRGGAPEGRGAPAGAPGASDSGVVAGSLGRHGTRKGAAGSVAVVEPVRDTPCKIRITLGYTTRPNSPRRHAMESGCADPFQAGRPVIPVERRES